MYETFDLIHITLKDDIFFAKTATCHAIAANFAEYDILTAFSYAYSNHYSYVVNSSYIDGLARIYHKNTYQEIKFTPVDNYELIWDSRQNTETKPVTDAITAGRRLKIALFDSQGYWNIHPVHMQSFHIDKSSFELLTDQDAIPEFLRHEKMLELLEQQMKERIKQAIQEHSPRNMREVFSHSGFRLTKPEFYSTFYTISSNGEYQRAGTAQEKPQRYKKLRVFADKLIGM